MVARPQSPTKQAPPPPRRSKACPSRVADSFQKGPRGHMWHDSEDRIGKAVERFEEGAVEAARIMLRGLDRRGVVSPRIDLYLGHCHLEADEHRAALRRYRRCIAQGIEGPAPWIGIGLCHGRLGRVERAIQAFQEALRRRPEVEEAHCNLVHCHALEGDVARAEHHAQRATTLDPHCPHVHRHLALAYLLADQPDRSLAAWRRVADLAPAHPELPVGVGRAYAMLGRRAEARRCFLDALAGPFVADARYGLGDLARAQGDVEAALEHYERAVAADGGFDEARLAWAETLEQVGRVERAYAVLAPLRREGGALGADVAVLIARLRRARGRRAAGLRGLRAWLARRTGEAYAWGHVGQYLLDVGRARAAASLLARARRLAPGDPRLARLQARAAERAASAKIPQPDDATHRRAARGRRRLPKREPGGRPRGPR